MIVVRKIILSTFVICVLTLGLSAQEPAGTNTELINKKLDKFTIEKVSFPKEVKRDPTLSDAERISIVEERLRIEREEKARLKKIADEEESKRLAEEKRVKREEYLRKNPSVEVIGKIKIQGLIDKEAIINNKIYSVGDRFYVSGNRNPIKIIYIDESYVRFEYKGQRFNKTIK